MKKEMYRVQIEVTTQQSERIHLERESYSKAKECRLFSGARAIVARIEADTAARRNAKRTRTQASGQPPGHQRDMVCAVDGMSMESSEAGLVWSMQQYTASTFSGMAAKRGIQAADASAYQIL